MILPYRFQACQPTSAPLRLVLKCLPKSGDQWRACVQILDTRLLRSYADFFFAVEFPMLRSSNVSQHLRCATCERLKGPRQPKPASSGTISTTVSQFNELIQGDFFYVRLCTGKAVQVFGLADTAMGFHQAAILRAKGERVWLRPYGLPTRLLPLFQGEFDDRLATVNVRVDSIGVVERRNAVLRTILEKLISDYGARRRPPSTRRCAR